MITKRFGVGILVLAMLLVCMVFMPTVGATDNNVNTAKNNASDNSLA